MKIRLDERIENKVTNGLGYCRVTNDPGYYDDFDFLGEVKHGEHALRGEVKHEEHALRKHLAYMDLRTEVNDVIFAANPGEVVFRVVELSDIFPDPHIHSRLSTEPLAPNKEGYIPIPCGTDSHDLKNGFQGIPKVVYNTPQEFMQAFKDGKLKVGGGKTK